MGNLIPILMLVAGLAIGGVTIWLILRSRVEQAGEKARAETESERATLLERLQGRDEQL